MIWCNPKSDKVEYSAGWFRITTAVIYKKKENKPRDALETRNQRFEIRDKGEELSKRDTIMTKQKYDFD